MANITSSKLKNVDSISTNSRPINIAYENCSSSSKKSIYSSSTPNVVVGESARAKSTTIPNTRTGTGSGSASAPSGTAASKPRKWYSFTNLLNRSTNPLKNIILLPRSRLSVSSLFSTSSSINEEVPPERGGSAPYEVSPQTPNLSLLSNNHQNEHDPYYAKNLFHYNHLDYPEPGSPTPSSATVSGEFPSRNSSYQYSSFRKTRNHSLSSGSGPRSFPTASSSQIPDFLIPSKKVNLTKTNRNRLSCGEFYPAGSSSIGFGIGGTITCNNPGGPNSIGGTIENSGTFQDSGRNYNITNLRRSLPTLLESMETCSSSINPGGNHNNPQAAGSNGIGGIDSVTESLLEEYIILTGTKTIDDHYLLVFPDRNNFHQLEDEDYKKLVRYLVGLPPMQDAESGFVIIIDRRSDKWNSVKTTLLRISAYFPGLIHRVFVLRPIGFLQKALSEVSSKLFRTENLKFRLTVCNSVADLGSFIDSSQLLNELGGHLIYNSLQWVKERVEVESFHSGLQSLSRELKGFTESFRDLEYPNDVSSTEQLIESKTNEYSFLKSDLQKAASHGENILKKIKGFNNKSHSTVPLMNIISIERFILQIDETDRLFTSFWNKEKVGLENCLQLRKFEQEFRELQISFDLNLKLLTSLPEMGETLESTDSLILDTINFQEQTKSTLLKHTLELELIGKTIVSTVPSSKDTVEPKYRELQRMSQSLKDLLHDKLQRQKQWRNIQSTLETSNTLCTNGMDILSLQKLKETSDSLNLTSWTQMKEELEILNVKIDEQLFELVDMKVVPVEGKSLIKEVQKRVEDLQTMISKRQSYVQLHIDKCKTSACESVRQHSRQEDFEPNSIDIADGLRCSSLKKSPLELHHHNGSTKNGTGTTSDESRVKEKQIKRYHVLQELLQTEETYVDEIGLILKGYRDQTTNPDLQSILPVQLYQDPGNVSILFCNLDEIFKFHSQIFLPDLKACIGSIELVALCFIQRHSDFLAMYSQYCQLKATSDVLLKEIGEGHSWLVYCQEKLRHRLPLSSYLLKPVQRITKYHLLLGSLLKYSSDACPGFIELSEALDCMVVVVRSVNDGMHQLQIRGYPAKLSLEGPLLLQAPFTVWIETPRNSIKFQGLSYKGHSRYLFLYQKSILVCKKSGSGSNLAYEFKNKINLYEIGITEDPKKGSNLAKKFEIWIQGRQKVFTLQASSNEIKNLWVGQIKKLLMEQLEVLRENNAVKNAKQISKASTLNGWRNMSSSGIGGVTPNTRPASGISTLSSSTEGSSIDSGRPKSRSLDTDVDDYWSGASEVSASEDEDSSMAPTPDPPSRSNTKSLNKLGVCITNTVPVQPHNINNENDTGTVFTVLADYCPPPGADTSKLEIALKEGESVELLKVGVGGWVFVRTMGPIPKEGWAPKAYLEHQQSSVNLSRKSSFHSTSMTDGFQEAPLPTTHNPSPMMNKLHKQASVPCLLPTQKSNSNTALQPSFLMYNNSYSSSSATLVGVDGDELGVLEAASSIRKLCNELVQSTTTIVTSSENEKNP